MGQHKFNPNAQAAKNGELPPKKKKMGKRKREALMRRRIQDATGFPGLCRDLGAEYVYI